VTLIKAELGELFMAADEAGELESTERLAKLEFRPSAENFKLGVGKAMIEAALNEVISDKNLGTEAASLHSAGKVVDIAAGAREVAKQMGVQRVGEPLGCQEVLDSIVQVGYFKGAGSRAKKTSALADLFRRASGDELLVLIRLCLGELRLGIGNAIVDAALEWSNGLPSQPEQSSPLKPKPAKSRKPAAATAAPQRKRRDAAATTELANAASGEGRSLQGQDSFVKPMLAKPIKSFQKVADLTASPANASWLAEWKYDGERIQIHLRRGLPPQVYSRSHKNTTEKYSDLAGHFQEALAEGTDEVILDGEVMAYDPETDEDWDFNTLSTRKARLMAGEVAEVQVRARLFDCLYRDKDLLRLPLADRRQELKKALDVNMLGVHPAIRLAEAAELRSGSSAQEWEEAFAEAAQAGVEGIIVKGLQAAYKPGSRSVWFKVKKDYLDGQIADSIDAVAVGIRRGEGKTASSFGSFLLAVPHVKKGKTKLKTISFAGSGLSVAERQAAFKSFRDHLTEERPKDVETSEMEADMWIPPDLRSVWEVKAYEITESDSYSSGLSLRFPRLLRLREDKDVAEATSLSQLEHLFSIQGDLG